MTKIDTGVYVPHMKYYSSSWPYENEVPVNINKCLHPVVITYERAEENKFHQCNRNRGHGQDNNFCYVHAKMMEKAK